MAKFQFIEWLIEWFEQLNDQIIFDWDAGNSTKNITKHGVSCEEAESVFMLRNKVRVLGQQISPEVNEPRYGLFGATEGKRLVFVCFTIREKHIRVISIRELNRKEAVIYEKLCKR